MEPKDEATKSMLRNSSKMAQSFPLKLTRKENNLPKRIRKVRGDQFKKLTTLYRDVDEIFSHINKYAACSKGCSSCCHIPVSISELEVLHIEKQTGKKAKPTSLPQNFHGQPCPFLTNNACSIYEHRPLVCRKHVSFTSTAYWCSIERCNELDQQMLKLTGVNQAFEELRNSSGMGELFDIRQKF